MKVVVVKEVTSAEIYGLSLDSSDPFPSILTTFVSIPD
jgi:hypothetical protein